MLPSAPALCDAEAKEMVSPFGGASSLERSSSEAWCGGEEVLAMGVMIFFNSAYKPCRVRGKGKPEDWRGQDGTC